MKLKQRLLAFGALFLLAGAVAGFLLLLQVGLAAAAPGVEDAEGPDVPITGDALDQASAAALDHLGEGRVTETEVGDEEGYFEIEVTLADGRQVDVHLDENFNFLSQESDGPGED